MQVVWRARKVSVIYTATKKTHDNLDHKNKYVSNIANSFPWLVMETHFQRSGTYWIFKNHYLYQHFNLSNAGKRCAILC